jgi:curved DNA-binding protein CbpA
LLPTAPAELVRAAHKVLIKQVHPDRGGSHEQATKINVAWEIIRADLERRSA